MNIQEIIVGIIVLVSFYYLLKHIVHTIKRIRSGKTACNGCALRNGCKEKEGMCTCHEQKNT